MKLTKKMFLSMIIFTCMCMIALPQAFAANARFDVSKMGDMSDFDPGNPIIPTGDTIKIAVVASFSGPAAIVGDIYFISVQAVAHDINKRGGILVDGKKKLVQVIKANHESKVPTCKKVCERMVLQEKVHVLWGTNGSHLMKVINQVAKKYKVIAIDAAALSDELYDATNFTRYSFMTNISTQQVGRAAAYYYGQVRKKEKKFYILCQDYLFGHSLASGFKKGLKEYYPAAQIVGEDYHQLFLKDFAPFLTKIKASGAEVIYTGDWPPDSESLLVQARQMNITLPIANLFLDEPNMLHRVGVEGTKGLIHIAGAATENPTFKTEDDITYYRAWNDQWKKWKGQWGSKLFEHGTGNLGFYRMQTYWLLSVIERAGTLKPEKIIKTFENDTYEDVYGTVYTMRACDHKAMRDMFIEEYVEPARQKDSFNIEPYYWYQGCSEPGPVTRIPQSKIIPLSDPKLCK